MSISTTFRNGGTTGNSIAIGFYTGGVLTGQGSNTISIGFDAGAVSQGGNCIAVGVNAGKYSQNGNAIAIGNGAGQTNQGGNAIAIGYTAGQYTQGRNAIAIGLNAGQTNQGASAIAVGIRAGQDSQGLQAIAIGDTAGFTGQGSGAIAIGINAGLTNQPANSIIINATGVAINGNANVGTCYIAPIRSTAVDVSYATYSFLKYNQTTDEVVCSTNTGAFIYRFHSTTQTMTANGLIALLFDSSNNRSFGNTGLTYNNSTGAFTNNSSSTLVLNVSGCATFNSNGALGSTTAASPNQPSAGIRQLWIQHSNQSNAVFNRLGYTTIAGLQNEIVSCSTNATLTLLTSESFIIYAYSSSSASVSTLYIANLCCTYMSAVLLN